ncbi:hypothetical protein [Roseovarius mucosus]|uniref:hypothetical protein n=1 Tax=Roseovarius mucosus TaxID=215743 RepID=UPI003F71A59A
MRGLALLAVMLSLAPIAKAQEAPIDAWTLRKCALYAQATEDALAALGPEGLSPQFLEENRAFIASGCVGHVRICAQTAQDYAFADLLTMMTMNEGMASTFVPFGCDN